MPQTQARHYGHRLDYSYHDDVGKMDLLQQIGYLCSPFLYPEFWGRIPIHFMGVDPVGLLAGSLSWMATDFVAGKKFILFPIPFWYFER